MDIELARTFIEIVGTGSFIKAADRLHVAQTTVSARVRLLEQCSASGISVLSYMNYYNEARTHLSLEKDSPVSRNVQRAGHILFLCRPVLAGCITYIFGFDMRQAQAYFTKASGIVISHRLPLGLSLPMSRTD